MPPSKSTKKVLSTSRAGNVKDKASPYNKGAAGGAKSLGASAGSKKTTYQPSKPIQARNKHKNVNLTSELDSLLGDLNSQLQRKKTKKDARGANNSGMYAAEQALDEAQAKHEALQNDMMDALDGISTLGNWLVPVRTSPVPQAVLDNRHHQSVIRTESATILDILGERSEFSKLLELIQKDKDLTNLLADAGTQPTLFAPTNDAFDSIDDIDYPTRDVLMYHISSQAYNSSSLRGEALIKSLYDSPGLNNSPQFLRISLEKPSIPSTSVRNSLWGVEPEIWIPELELDDMDAEEAGLYINRAKVIQPDLIAQSGGIVHGVSRIIRPPGETILDEVMRRGIHFTFLTKAWAETGVDAHVRDGKSLTLFAPSDNAWQALPKKLVKWLFSAKGREHLKIFTMYQIGNKAIYTHDIFNRTLDDGTPAKKYREISLQTLLNSPEYELKIQGKARKSFWDENEKEEHLPSLKPKGLTDLIDWKDLVHTNNDPTPVPRPSPTDRVSLLTPEPGNPGCPEHPDRPGHHYPHKNPNHPHHHGKHHKHHKHHNHRHHPHGPRNGGGGGGGRGGGHKMPKHALRRDEIFVNGKARVVHGHENWIAGNGVIHVIDKVLIPPRRKGCHMMNSLECSVWETLWDLASAEPDGVMEDVTDFFNDLTLFEDEHAENQGNTFWGGEVRWFDAENTYNDEEVKEQGQGWDEYWTPIIVA
ncbi:hypothetical protein BGZ52_012902 [Haplosporangium bisporale]|nr:hypothetical protein BGZ52_012902 [Haplosporangium bisporale]